MDWVVRCWRRSDRSIDRWGESEPEMNILRKKKKKTNWLGVCIHPADQSRVYIESNSLSSAGDHMHPHVILSGPAALFIVELVFPTDWNRLFLHRDPELDTCVHSTWPLVASIAHSFISQFSSPVGSQASSSSPLYNIDAAAAVTAQHPRPINTTRRQFQRVCVCVCVYSIYGRLGVFFSRKGSLYSQ